MDTTEDSLITIAKRIRVWQAAEALSDAEMLRRYRGLGSDKTYKRIPAGDLTELDAESWLVKYRAVWSIIESLQDVEQDDEGEILTLSGVNAVRKALLPVFKEKGNGRLVFVTGDTGAGKSSVASWLLGKYGERLIRLECFQAWDDRPNAFLGDLLRALGLAVNHDIASAADKLRVVIEDLRITRRCVLLDEAHHLGPKCLNTLKALINQTPGEFVAFAMPTLWNRLKQAAYEECRQLSGNRLAERVTLTLQPHDVQTLLRERLGMNGDAKPAADLLMDAAARHGNLSFIRDVITRARRAAKGQPVSVELIQQCAANELASR